MFNLIGIINFLFLIGVPMLFKIKSLGVIPMRDLSLVGLIAFTLELAENIVDVPSSPPSM